MSNKNNQAQKCANEIMKWLVKRDLTLDVSIYVNNCRYQYNEKAKTWNVEEDEDPRTYFEYTGDFLSMSFEGPLYDVMNYNYSVLTCDKLTTEFSNICSKYNKYYEQGNAWNLSLYNI